MKTKETDVGPADRNHCGSCGGPLTGHVAMSFDCVGNPVEVCSRHCPSCAGGAAVAARRPHRASSHG